MYPTRQTILAVGPPTHMMGGMAQVAEQVHRLDGRAGCRVVPFHNTHSRDGQEIWPARVTRHVRHIRMLRRAIHRLRPTIVHIHTCSGFSFHRSVVDMLVAQRACRPVILHIHGAAFDAFYKNAGRLERRAIQWSLKRADRVIALSRTWQDKLSAMAPESHISVIENAVDIPGRVSTPSTTDPCRFVLLARMDVWKGIDDLLTACTLLRNEKLPFQLDLAGPPGSAGDRHSLAEKIREIGLERFVRYVGPVRGDAKSDLLLRSHAYVQPSHNEGMPIAVLEAMAHGLPVVATRVGGVPEMFSDGTQGILTPDRHPVRLAGAMRSLIIDTGRRARMAFAARALAVKRFGLDRFHTDLSALYQEVAGARASRGEASSFTDAASMHMAVR